VYIRYHFWGEKATAISISISFFSAFARRSHRDVRSVTHVTKRIPPWRGYGRRASRRRRTFSAFSFSVTGRPLTGREAWIDVLRQLRADLRDAETFDGAESRGVGFDRCFEKRQILESRGRQPRGPTNEAATWCVGSGPPIPSASGGTCPVSRAAAAIKGDNLDAVFIRTSMVILRYCEAECCQGVTVKSSIQALVKCPSAVDHQYMAYDHIGQVTRQK
jgi:hypothetical protein